MSKWIRCSEKLPENDQYVLACGYGSCHVYGPYKYIASKDKNWQCELCQYTEKDGFKFGEYSCTLEAV